MTWFSKNRPLCTRIIFRNTWFNFSMNGISRAASKQFSTIIKTQSSVSATKKTKDARHISVLFTCSIKLPNSAFRISKSTKLISNKLKYFLPYIYTTLHIKIEGNHFSISQDICSWKMFNFLFTQNYKYI